MGGFGGIGGFGGFMSYQRVNNGHANTPIKPTRNIGGKLIGGSRSSSSSASFHLFLLRVEGKG